MAEAARKKWVTWTMADDMLTQTVKFDASNEPDLVIDIRDYWKSTKFENLEDVEKQGVWNGVKQKIVDKNAAAKELAITAKEKRANMVAIWHRLCVKRQWNAPAEGGKGGLPFYMKALKELDAKEAGVRQVAEMQEEPIKSAILSGIPKLDVEGKTREEWLVVKAEAEAKKAEAKEAERPNVLLAKKES